MMDRKTKEIKKDWTEKVTKRQEQRSQAYPYVNRKRLFQQIKQVDRSEQCPFLVRIFYAINNQNHYKHLNDLPLQRQVKLHLWVNSTLKQISQLLRAMMPNIRTKQKFFFWKLSYSKQKQQYEKQQLGWVYASKRYDKVQQKALCHTKFNIGDIIDVSITYK